jgi:hypothetical protein
VTGTGIDVNFIVDGDDDGVAQRIKDRFEQLAIESAWLTAALARTGEPDRYDAALSHLCEDAMGLQLIPVLLPPVGSRGALERAQRVARTATCRVARLCPFGHSYPLVDWILSPLPELCVREGIALELDFDPEPIPWLETVAFARTFPCLPLILLGVPIEKDRALAAALDAAPNLVVHVTDATPGKVLSAFVEMYGSARFVWGSAFSSNGLPNASAGGRESLGNEAREAIVRGNARALAEGSYADTFL